MPLLVEGSEWCILGAFALQTEIVSFVLFARMEQLRSHWTDFMKFYICGFFENLLERFNCFNVNFGLLNTIYVHLLVWYWNNLLGKIQVSLQSHKNDGYFTWRPIYILIISRAVISRMKNVSDKWGKKNQNAHFMCKHLFFFFFENRAVYEIMWKSSAGHRRQIGACTLHAIYLRLQTHTQTM